MLSKDKDAKIKGVEVAWEVLARPKQRRRSRTQEAVRLEKTKILRHIRNISAISVSIWVV